MAKPPLRVSLCHFKERNFSMKIKKWIRTGELDPCITDSEGIIEAAGAALDKNCAYDILGEVMFEADDGKYYVVNVEASILEANPEYVKQVLEEDEE